MAKNKKNHHLRKICDSWYFEKMVNGNRIKKALGESVTEASRLRNQYLKEILVYGVFRNPILSRSEGHSLEKWPKNGLPSNKRKSGLRL